MAWRQFLNKYQVKVEAKWVDDLKRTVYERLTRTDLSVPSLFQVLDEGKGKGKLLGRTPNSSVPLIPTCPSQHPFRLAGSQTP